MSVAPPAAAAPGDGAREGAVPDGVAALDRPRLAFVSPVPPSRSGIADTAATLLPALSRFYAIDVVCPQPEVDDPWIAAHCTLCDPDAFDANAHRYDRIVWHVGNALFHAHMLPRIARLGGTVVLHDLVLSDLLNHLERTGEQPGAFVRALYRSHGWTALVDDRVRGRERALRRWPCSLALFEQADGVILQSEFAADWARRLWGGRLPLRVVPLPHRGAVGREPRDRAGARERLGLPADAFVVCSFGVVDPSKLCHRLADAWAATPLATDPGARLVFVGACPDPAYQARLTGRPQAPSLPGEQAFARTGDHAHPAIVTGYATPESYRDWLSAADLAVQLRTGTRGESSGAALDCLAAGVPTVVNAHGTLAELPAAVVRRLPDAFSDTELAAAITELAGDPAVRRQVGEAARTFAAEVHSPEAVAAAHADAIEAFLRDSRPARVRRRARVLRSFAPRLEPATQAALRQQLDACDPGVGPPQLLLDVTALALHDLRSGIQRVVRGALLPLLERGVRGYRVEPVRLLGGTYRHAREFTAGLLGLDPTLSRVLEDDPVHPGPGDVFLGLDLVIDQVPDHEAGFQHWRERGVQVWFLVHDLLPERRPDWFPDEANAHFRRWLRSVARTADGFVCNSRATAEDLTSWLAAEGPARPRAPLVRWFHLGADVLSSLPTSGASDEHLRVLQRIGRRRAFLMVGTVERRKGHAAALQAFERLWSAGLDVDLVIAGRTGWMVDALVERLRGHPEGGRRLFWLEDASDATLVRLYDEATALVAASEGEGFGLPLVEAARHGLPVIARDLPVFREVAGADATYWRGSSPASVEGDAEALATALVAWLGTRDAGGHPRGAPRPWRDWSQATADLIAAVLGPGATLGPARDDAPEDTR